MTGHPNVGEYRSGGIGHLPDDASRSVVGLVPTARLVAFREHDGMQNPHVPGHDRAVIDGIVADLRAGVGLREPLMMSYDHELGLGSLGEGNHRLAAALEAGTVLLPVRVHARAGLARRAELGLCAPLRLLTVWTDGCGLPYVPPAVHPAHFGLTAAPARRPQGDPRPGAGNAPPGR